MVKARAYRCTLDARCKAGVHLARDFVQTLCGPAQTRTAVWTSFSIRVGDFWVFEDCKKQLFRRPKTGKTAPVRMEAAELSPLEVKCLENVEENQECLSAQTEVVAPDKTLEPVSKLRTEAGKEYQSNWRAPYKRSGRRPACTVFVFLRRKETFSESSSPISSRIC